MTGADRLALRVLRAGMPWTLLLGLAALAETALGLALPAVLGQATDTFVDRRDPVGPVLVVVAVVVGLTVVEAVGAYVEQRATARSMRWVRLRFLDRLFRFDLRGQRGYPAGDLVNRFTNNTNHLASSPMSLLRAGTTLLMSLGGIVALFVVDLWSGLLFVAGIPIVWWLSRRWLTRMTDTNSVYIRHHSAIATRLLDALRGIRTIRASGTARREIERVLAPVDALRGTALELWRQQIRIGLQGTLLQPVLMVGVLVLAGFALTAGRLGPGDVLAVSGYLTIALGVLRYLPMMSEVGMVRGSAGLVDEVLAGPVQDGGTRALPRGPAHVRLDGVGVDLGGATVLDGVELEIPAGTTMALVGRSGAGKTTLSAVVGGLLTPDRGVVRIDGVPLGDIDAADLRAVVAYAYERPQLLGDTLRDALTYGAPDTPAATVDRALAATDSAGFVDRLPDRLETPLDELRLSGGEMQRLGLARAAGREAGLLVLDDALSSVDTATEASITRSLTGHADGTTRLLIAHRPSTAASADVVAWLHDGRIRAVAPHARLSDDPEYRDLFGDDGDAPDAGTRADGAEVSR